MNTSPTDNLKVLKIRTGRSVSELRALAQDLGLDVEYSRERHCWYLNERADIVAMFNEHLTH